MPTGEFKEIQRFNQWWIYLLVSLPALLLVMIGLLHVHDKHGELIRFSDVLLPMAIPLLVLVWLLSMRLITQIDQQGIRVYFRGIPFSRRNIPWDEISTADVVRYSPLGDYGGFGLRYSFVHGWCYQVRGRTGIRLRLKNGKQVLVGTQQQEEVSAIISYYLPL